QPPGECGATVPRGPGEDPGTPRRHAGHLFREHADHDPRVCVPRSGIRAELVGDCATRGGEGRRLGVAVRLRGGTVQAATDSVRPVSRTFPRQSLDRILREAQPFTDSGHYLYPADATGSHTKGFFAIEPVTRVNTFVDAIADDMERWSGRHSIS